MNEKMSKIIFGIVSSLPPAIFLVFWYLGKLEASQAQGIDFFHGFGYFLMAMSFGGISSFGITIGGIIHVIREKKKKQETGYYVFFTVIAALPLFLLLYEFLLYSSGNL